MLYEARRYYRVALDGGYVAGFTGGSGGTCLLLICMGRKDQGCIERRQACDWRVLSIGPSGHCDEYRVRLQKDNFDFVQSLADGLFLATSRCEYLDGHLRPNGKVFARSGELLSSLVLGDGIQDIQTTRSGLVWVSYFDEGIFGHFASKHSIGRFGLRQFDIQGNSTFEFNPPSGLDHIADCYALNATSENEAWCYYYTQFPIVRIQDRRVVQHWLSPISGASAFCVWRDTVLIQGGYQCDDWKLLHLAKDGTVRVGESYTFTSETGQVLRSSSARARGSSIWFLEGDDVFFVNLRDLIS